MDGQMLCCRQETKLSLGHASAVECVSFLIHRGNETYKGSDRVSLHSAGLAGFIC